MSHLRPLFEKLCETASPCSFECGQPDGVIMDVSRHPIPSANALSFRPSLRIASNSSQARISKVNLLDLDLGPVSTTPQPVLHGFNGGAIFTNDRDFPLRDWSPRVWTIPEQQPLYLHSGRDGRCSINYLPLFWLQLGDEGLWFGPEYAGSWDLELAVTSDGRYHLRLGLPNLSFIPHSGETILLPAVSLGIYCGELDSGQMAVRRFIRDHLRPAPRLGLDRQPVVYRALGGQVSRYDQATLRSTADELGKLGFEVFTWGTGWFRALCGSTKWENENWARPSSQRTNPDAWMNFWETIGDFLPAADRFPDSIQATTADMNHHGLRHGLWIDPRISPDTTAHATAPAGSLLPFTEFIERDKIWKLSLIDTGTAAGRDLLLSLLERFVTDYGASWLWHDLNVEPRARYFDTLEPCDRRGLAELAYHLGMDRVYDTLRARHPEVALQWCGSGGTMVHLGILRRCEVLWVDDYEKCERLPDGRFSNDAARTFRSALHRWLPASYLLNSLNLPSDFTAQSPEPLPWGWLIAQIGGVFSIGHYIEDWRPVDVDRLREALTLFKEIRPLLDGDFHPLFPIPADRSSWDGWQFHDPATGSGLLFLFRLADSGTSTATFSPRWLDASLCTFTLRLGEGSLTPAGPGRLVATVPLDAALFTYVPTLP